MGKVRGERQWKKKPGGVKERKTFIEEGGRKRVGPVRRRRREGQ